MSTTNLRLSAIKLVENDTAKFHWAFGLPKETLDEEATNYLSSADGNPLDLVESCNPFAVSDRIADVASLFELTAKLRIDALSKEGALINEILLEQLASESSVFERNVAKVAFEADWKSSQRVGSSQVKDVEDIFDLASKARVNRLNLRSTPGHPFNLIEQILELRRRYCLELRILLARAESIKLILKASFAYSVPSLLKALPKNASPVSSIGDWLRDMSLGLERNALESRVVTMYRFLGANNWTTEDVRNILVRPGDAIFTVNLNRQLLGLTDQETARILAIGVAPTFGMTTSNRFSDAADAANKMPLISNSRAMQRQISFDCIYTLSAVALMDNEKTYNYPATTEFLGGVAGWGVDDGAAENAVALRSNSAIENRPFESVLTIKINSWVFANWGIFGRQDISILSSNADASLSDVLVGVRFAVHKIT